MHELKLIQDRREALRRQEDEILANENAHHSRAEMEHRKKIINNFGTDSTPVRGQLRHRPRHHPRCRPRRRSRSLVSVHGLTWTIRQDGMASI